MRALVPVAALMLVAPSTPEASLPTLDISRTLRADLARRLEDPAAFSAAVAAETRGFPEGELFSRVLPIYGLVSIGMQDPTVLPEVEVLLSQAVAATEAHVGQPLLAMDGYGGHGTWLGHLGVALGAYELLGGQRFSAERSHVAELLSTALDAADGAPIESYPGLTWSYDTTPAILAVYLEDRASGSRLLDAHLAWLADNHHAETGLPYSRQIPAAEPPRGCDLSLRIGLLAQMDLGAAEAMYADYVTHFWQGVGFREYPKGSDGIVDADSGPIIGGLGLAATGNGFGAVRAVRDLPRQDVLGAQLAVVGPAIWAAHGTAVPGLGGMRVDRGYQTGFLFGDLVLLHATAYQDWGVSRP